MVVQEVTVELSKKPTEIKKVKKGLEEGYEQYGVDFDKVRQYGSVYLIMDGCEVTKDLMVVGDGTVEIIYGKCVKFFVANDGVLQHVPSMRKVEVRDGDELIPLQTFKNYPRTDRYQQDRDSFVIYFKTKK